MAAVHPLDVVRAGHWTRALFGTFALSLGFFEAAPLRALRRGGATDIRILADVSGVAGSLGEAGAREVGRTYGLEAIRVPAGCFHPKFVLLDGADGPRMIVGSGNLTFGGWGRNLELCEVLSPETAPAAFADMAGFLEALATSPRLDFPRSEVAASWGAALQRLPTVGDEAEVRLVHNVDRPISDQLVEMAAAAGGASKLLVASPYFGDADAVRDLAVRLGIERVQVHVSTSLAVAGRHYGFEADPAAEPVVISDLDEGRKQRPMHAKLIEIECRDTVLAVTGSVNASGPALSRAGNVELAVVRRRPAPSSAEPFTGPLPPIPSIERDDGGAAPTILLATMVGRTLSGVVMGVGCEGTWSARLDATGEFRNLGDVEVRADRRFEVTVAAGDEIGFGSRRAILVLADGDRRVAGFVTFPDLLELNRRWGASAGAIIRVVGGSEEDEDMAGVLEYFSRHPDETAAPWSGAARSRPDEDFVDDRVVSLGDLAVRPRAEAAEVAGGGWGSSAIDRLIGAIRRSITGGVSVGRGGPPRDRGEEADGDEGPAGTPPPPPPARTDRVFADLSEAFASRVPIDPQTELHRLAELGLCVLARRPDAERFADFVSWWCAMAVAHLRCGPDRADLRRLATLLLLFDGLVAGSPLSTRRRIASIVGGVDEAVDDALGAVPSRMAVLIEEAGPGPAAFDAFVSRVRSERSAIEELPAILAAIRAGVEPPPSLILDREPEMAQLRRRITSGFAARIPTAGPKTTSCPRCSIGFAAAELVRLRSVGLVVARNCCAAVVVMDLDL